jgi:hypothetical protein
VRSGIRELPSGAGSTGTEEKHLENEVGVQQRVHALTGHVPLLMAAFDVDAYTRTSSRLWLSRVNLLAEAEAVRIRRRGLIRPPFAKCQSIDLWTRSDFAALVVGAMSAC